MPCFCCAPRGALAKADRCPCSASAVSAAGSASAAQPAALLMFPRGCAAGPLALSRFLRRGAVPACKNRSAAPASPRCFCRRQRSAQLPHTGALNHKLLLLPQRRTADLLPVGLPLCRGMIYTHPPAPLAVSPCRCATSPSGGPAGNCSFFYWQCSSCKAPA